jgi:Xaa-Pro aminopeptidase
MAPLRNGDVHYPFRVDSDFFAWTGLDIEGAILLHDMTTQEQILFFDEPDNQKRIWESIRWDTSILRKAGFSGQILPRSELVSYLS